MNKVDSASSSSITWITCATAWTKLDPENRQEKREMGHKMGRPHIFEHDVSKSTHFRADRKQAHIFSGGAQTGPHIFRGTHTSPRIVGRTVDKPTHFWGDRKQEHTFLSGTANKFIDFWGNCRQVYPFSWNHKVCLFSMWLGHGSCAASGKWATTQGGRELDRSRRTGNGASAVDEKWTIRGGWTEEPASRTDSGPCTADAKAATKRGQERKPARRTKNGP